MRAEKRPEPDGRKYIGERLLRSKGSDCGKEGDRRKSYCRLYLTRERISEVIGDAGRKQTCTVRPPAGQFTMAGYERAAQRAERVSELSGSALTPRAPPNAATLHSASAGGARCPQRVLKRTTEKTALRTTRSTSTECVRLRVNSMRVNAAATRTCFRQASRPELFLAVSLVTQVPKNAMPTTSRCWKGSPHG